MRRRSGLADPFSWQRNDRSGLLYPLQAASRQGRYLLQVLWGRSTPADRADATGADGLYPCLATAAPDPPGGYPGLLQNLSRLRTACRSLHARLWPMRRSLSPTLPTGSEPISTSRREQPPTLESCLGAHRGSARPPSRRRSRLHAEIPADAGGPG